MDVGVLIIIGVVCLAYASWVSRSGTGGRTNGLDTRPLAAVAQARRGTFVRPSRPLGLLGAILVFAGVLLLVTGA